MYSCSTSVLTLSIAVVTVIVVTVTAQGRKLIQEFVVVGKHGSRQQALWQEQAAENSPPLMKAPSRESELEVEQGDVVSKLAPRDRLPPARLHWLNLSNSAGN